ncbi:hypothetical protein LINPERPRIM_LOCUS11237, partial [Linum perenne]
MLLLPSVFGPRSLWFRRNCLLTRLLLNALLVSAKLKVWFRRNWMCNGQISDLILVDSLIDSGLIPRGPNALDTSLATLFDGK